MSWLLASGRNDRMLSLFTRSLRVWVGRMIRRHKRSFPVTCASAWRLPTSAQAISGPCRATPSSLKPRQFALCRYRDHENHPTRNAVRLPACQYSTRPSNSNNHQKHTCSACQQNCAIASTATFSSNDEIVIRSQELDRDNYNVEPGEPIPFMWSEPPTMVCRQLKQETQPIFLLENEFVFWSNVFLYHSTEPIRAFRDLWAQLRLRAKASSLVTRSIVQCRRGHLQVRPHSSRSRQGVRQYHGGERWRQADTGTLA